MEIPTPVGQIVLTDPTWWQVLAFVVMVVILAAIWAAMRQAMVGFARAVVREAARALGVPLELTDARFRASAYCEPPTASNAQPASSDDLFEDAASASKCIQSMTTYTSLRGATTARFLLLTLEQAGVWDELERKLPMECFQDSRRSPSAAS